VTWRIGAASVSADWRRPPPLAQLGTWHSCTKPASTECWPTGVPLILENTTMQIMQQPDKITILYSETYEVRQSGRTNLTPLK
jgi:hypothetical protein